MSCPGMAPEFRLDARWIGRASRCAARGRARSTARGMPAERRAPIELVHGPRISGGDEQVAVRIDAHGVDVEVVEGGARGRGYGTVALTEGHMIETVPLEDDPPGRDVELLDDTVGDVAVLRSPDRR